MTILSTAKIDQKVSEMYYVDQNIHLLHNFCTTDHKTVSTVKSDILPWAKERLGDYRDYQEIMNSSIFEDEIKRLDDGIKACEKRLLTVQI